MCNRLCVSGVFMHYKHDVCTGDISDIAECEETVNHRLIHMTEGMMNYYCDMVDEELDV